MSSNQSVLESFFEHYPGPKESKPESKTLLTIDMQILFASSSYNGDEENQWAFGPLGMDAHGDLNWCMCHLQKVTLAPHCSASDNLIYSETLPKITWNPNSGPRQRKHCSKTQPARSVKIFVHSSLNSCRFLVWMDCYMAIGQQKVPLETAHAKTMIHMLFFVLKPYKYPLTLRPSQPQSQRHLHHSDPMPLLFSQALLLEPRFEKFFLSNRLQGRNCDEYLKWKEWFLNWQDSYSKSTPKTSWQFLMQSRAHISPTDTYTTNPCWNFKNQNIQYRV